MIRLSGLGSLRAEQQRLRRLVMRLSDFQEVHAAAGRALRGWVRLNYDASGALHAELSGGWPPLAKATQAARRRRGRGTALLEDTGRLRAGTVLSSNARQAVLANPVPYAVRHQLGQGVPRRPIFPGMRQARSIAVKAISRHMEEILG